MAFQIKDFASIAASMINYMKSVTTKVTDFNQGSVVRTMLEAPAAELEELYLQMLIGLQEGIPVATYNTFGFDLLPAATASGAVRFSTATPAASAIPIPLGTLVQVPGRTITYATQVDASIAVGQTYVDVLCAASVPGSQGNVSAASITQMVGAVAGISSVSNPAPLVNGRDQETEADRLSRFRDYIRTLARGTISAVLYGAKTAQRKDASGNVVEYVAGAALDEPWLTNTAYPIGLVNVYVHNGASATSAALVAEAQKIIDGYYDADSNPVPGYKAAGVKVVVAAATDQSINVTGVVTVDPSFVSSTVLSDATAAIQVYIQNLGVGADVLKSELIAIVKRDVPGVLNVVLSVPAADVTVASSAKAIAGTITLTAA